MTRAIELEPGLVDAYFYLGMALYRQKRFGEALLPLETYRAKARRGLSAADLKTLDGVIAECRSRK